MIKVEIYSSTDALVLSDQVPNLGSHSVTLGSAISGVGFYAYLESVSQSSTFSQSEHFLIGSNIPCDDEAIAASFAETVPRDPMTPDPKTLRLKSLNPKTLRPWDPKALIL